jgi:hypothetical protein
MCSKPRCKQLPQAVVFAILAKLPVVEQLRMRLVCKQWNAELSSPQFLASCDPDQTDPCLPILRYQAPGDTSEFRFVAYNPSTKAWIKLCLDFLPVDSSSPKHVRAGGAGLLLVEAAAAPVADEASVAGKLFVCNPLNKSYKELPTCPALRLFSAAIAVDKHTKTYEVIVRGNNPPTSCLLNTYVYNPSVNQQQWRLVQQHLNSDQSVLLRPRQERLWHKDSLYFGSNKWCGLLAYNLQQEQQPDEEQHEEVFVVNSWSSRVVSSTILHRLKRPASSSCEEFTMQLRWFTMTEFQNHIFCAGLMVNTEANNFAEEDIPPRIWQLETDQQAQQEQQQQQLQQQARVNWKPIAEMPQYLWDKLLESTPDYLFRMRFISHSSSIVFIADLHDDHSALEVASSYSSSSYPCEMVTYDLATNTWDELPTFAIPTTRTASSSESSIVTICDCAFESRLDIFA